MHPADHHPAKIKKADKDFEKELKDIKFSVKYKDIHKIKNIYISAHPIYVSNKCCKDKHVDLLLIGKKAKYTKFLPKISIH